MPGTMINTMMGGISGQRQGAPEQKVSVGDLMINDALAGLGPEPPKHVFRNLQGAETYNPKTDIMMQVGNSVPGSADAAPVAIRRREPNPEFDAYGQEKQRRVSAVVTSPQYQMATNPSYATTVEQGKQEQAAAETRGKYEVDVARTKADADARAAAAREEQRNKDRVASDARTVIIERIKAKLDDDPEADISAEQAELRAARGGGVQPAAVDDGTSTPQTREGRTVIQGGTVPGRKNLLFQRTDDNRVTVYSASNPQNRREMSLEEYEAELKGQQ